MLFVVLSILFNVTIGLVFRYFRQYGVQNLPAIVVNYAVCGSMAAYAGGRYPWHHLVDPPGWLVFALVLGMMFTFGFWVLSYTVQYHGVGITSIVQKISLVVTALFAIFFFDEPFTVGKWVGIPLAVLAIFLIQGKTGQLLAAKQTRWIVALPVLTFLFNAIIDTALFYVEETKLAATGDFFFISTLFYTAGFFGLLFLVRQMVFDDLRVQLKDAVGGVALGIPNFFSIYFFLRALGSGFGGSVVVPINNVGIILLSAVLGVFLFSEKFKTMNVIGVVAAVLAILLISIEA